MDDSAATSSVARQLFENHIDTLTGQLQYAGKACLPDQEVEDFVAWGLLRILENDCRVLRRYENRAGFVTFASKVARRLAVDYCRRLWGRWKPSAVAKNHGAVGEALERLLWQDQLKQRQAVRLLRFNQRVAESTGRLLAIAAKLPCRNERKRAEPIRSGMLIARELANARLEEQEQRAEARRVGEVVSCCFSTVSEEDRSLLHQRFVEQRPVTQIAAELGIPAKTLYGRIDRCLFRIRREARDRGVTASQIKTALEFAEEIQISPGSLCPHG